MKNGVDFKYEYSDLNLFQTRVEILRGKYAGMILEFGGSILAQEGDKNEFSFDYTLYKVPAKFQVSELGKDKQFIEFLGYLLVDVIDARNHDKDELAKLHEAASATGKTTSNIKVDESFYFNFKKQPIAQGLQGF